MKINANVEKDKIEIIRAYTDILKLFGEGNKRIINALNNDKSIRKNVFNSVLTKESLARFTIKNILSAKNKEDKDVLLQIVKRAIY